jgi:hypothetical protein
MDSKQENSAPHKISTLNDLIFIAFLAFLFSPFYWYPNAFEKWAVINKAHGFIISFLKFAVLATMGEMLALRIKEGIYNKKGFGILPRAFVWGILGMIIKAVFIIFATGTPLLVKAVFPKLNAGLAGPLSGAKAATAFSISLCMNLIFAPVMMTFHRITDEHIRLTHGSMKKFFSKIDFAAILKNMNWDVMWNFVFKKTIPLFWIPAHTVTFLLPSQFQVLFAAVLGMVLGVLLAAASLKSNPAGK